MGATVVLLVAGMLLTGCLNTLLLKYQDQACEAVQSSRPTGCASLPVLQSLVMFFGESLCFLAIGIMKIRAYLAQQGRLRDGPLLVASEEYGPLSTEDDSEDGVLTTTMHKPMHGREMKGVATIYMALPALCDICGTTIGSVGLLFVPASIYQMCRGSLVLYVGLFSVLFLRRRLVLYQWLSLFLVTIGVFIVGLSNVVTRDPDQASTNVTTNAEHSLLGILLVAGAQLFTATQFVIEEWLLSRYSVEPLKVAGLEGIWGTLMSSLGIAVAYYAYGATPAGSNGTFDVGSGLATVLTHEDLWAVFLLFAICIASYNFFGLSVTQTVSATSRSTIDTCRTLFIWVISMTLGWEGFKILQLIGFLVQVYATLVFNGVIQPPKFLQSPEHLEVQTGQEHTLE